MAITSSPSSQTSRKSNKNIILASVWLIMSLLTGAAALALWVFSSAPSFEAEVVEEEEQLAETNAFNITQVSQIDELNELANDVHPISFDELVRDLRDYPPEFKDSRYLKKNKDKWTLQVMDVSEHDIISEYLKNRKDRDKFSYFRYRDDKDQANYILVYSTMTSEASAANKAKTMKFGLPENVEITPKQIGSYLDIIENYELTGPVKDLSSNRIRDVRLQPTREELAARRRAQESQQNRSNRNNTSSDDNNTVNSQNRDASPTTSNIKDSRDTSDTLSVVEERNVVINDDSNQSTSDGSISPEKVERIPMSESPKPDPVESAKPEAKRSGSEQSNNGNSPSSEVDKIRELIEEKTQ